MSSEIEPIPLPDPDTIKSWKAAATKCFDELVIPQIIEKPHILGPQLKVLIIAWQETQKDSCGTFPISFLFGTAYQKVRQFEENQNKASLQHNKNVLKAACLAISDIFAHGWIAAHDNHHHHSR
jgi:hypothetical protein